MHQEKLKPVKTGKDQIPYSKAEEWFNIISHMVGAVLAVAAAVLTIVKCSLHARRGDYLHPATAIVSVCIYGFTIILMYLMSTLYHSRRFGGAARVVFRHFDHCMIPLLIAGTYAPYTLIGLVSFGTNQPADFVWGIVIAGVVLAAAVLSVVFNSINVHKFRIFCMAAYLVMGWCVLIRVYHLALAVHMWCFLFLILGGVMYTGGVAFYSIKKIKFNHAIWHLFVIAGSVLHFVSIFFFLL